MSLILKCPNCHSKIKAPDKATGRTITCPACHQPFVVKSTVIVDDDTIVPPTPVPVPVSAPTAPVPAQPSKLINCPACGKSISPAAKDCPGCGNPNKYVHPEIQRFLVAAQSTFSQMPQFNYKVEGFNLSGWALVEKGASKWFSQGLKLVMAGLLMLLLGGGIPPLLPLAGLLILVGSVMCSSIVFARTKTSDYSTRFSIDFNQAPPLWQSDDDVFWKEIKAFFLGASGSQV